MSRRRREPSQDRVVRQLRLYGPMSRAELVGRSGLSRPTVVSALADLLAEVHQREKVTIVMVTHAPELARRMGRVLPLLDGRLTAV